MSQQLRLFAWNDVSLPAAGSSHTRIPSYIMCLYTEDFITEARKVARFNPWLNYALCLHRSRELGYHHPILDALTTRALDKDEVRNMCLILFGKKRMLSAPDLHTELRAFCLYIKKINKLEASHWNAQTQKIGVLVDVQKLQRFYGGRLSRWTRLFSSWGVKSTAADPEPQRTSSDFVEI